MFGKKVSIGLLLGSFSSFACSGAAVDSEHTSASQEPLYLIGNTWPQNSNGVHEVPVCFTAQSVDRDDYDAVRDKIRAAANATWGLAANIRFLGFVSCGSSDGGKLRIDITDPDTGSGSQFGYRGPSAPTKVHLRANPHQGTIAHEFGHALGFEHEFARPDWDNPSGCPNKNERPGGDTLGTPPDTESIMVATGYCQSNRVLSPWDKVGGQNAYGRKRAGLLVGLDNRCVDIPGSDATPGTELQVYSCKGSDNQLWRQNSSGKLLAPAYTQQTCFNVPPTPPTCLPPQPSAYMGVAGNGANGSRVQVSTVQEEWTFANTELRAIGGLCVDAESFSNRGVLRIMTCNESDNQKWTVEPDGVIRRGSWCFDVRGGGTSSGTPVQVYSCSGFSNQRFTRTAKGELMFGGKCVDVEGGDPTEGAELQLYTCKADSDLRKLNQRFNLRGELRNDDGKCMEIKDGNSFDGAPLQVNTCNGSERQRWDYYFNP